MIATTGFWVVTVLATGLAVIALLKKQYGPMMGFTVVGIISMILSGPSHFGNFLDKLNQSLKEISRFVGVSSRTPQPVDPAPRPPSVEVPQHLWEIVGVCVAVVVVILVVILVVIGLVKFGAFDALSDKKAARVKRRAAQAALMEHRAREWERVQARDQRIMDRMFEWGSDLGLLLSHPVMSDLTEPATEALTVAVGHLQDARPVKVDVTAPMKDYSVYTAAVMAAQVALDAAEVNAKKVADSHFGPGERKMLRRARKVLATALDSGTTSGERAVAYEQVQRLLVSLNRVMVVPEAAMSSVEARLSVESVLARELTTS